VRSCRTGSKRNCATPTPAAAIAVVVWLTHSRTPQYTLHRVHRCGRVAAHDRCHRTAAAVPRRVLGLQRVLVPIVSELAERVLGRLQHRHVEHLSAPAGLAPIQTYSCRTARRGKTVGEYTDSTSTQPQLARDPRPQRVLGAEVAIDPAPCRAHTGDGARPCSRRRGRKPLPRSGSLARACSLSSMLLLVGTSRASSRAEAR
jgi:hypothetical protein